MCAHYGNATWCAEAGLEVLVESVWQQRVWKEEVLARRSMWSIHWIVMQFCFFFPVWLQPWMWDEYTTDSILGENKDPLSMASPEECSIFLTPLKSPWNTMDDFSKILCNVILFRVKCLFLVYPVNKFVGSNLFNSVCKVQFLTQPTFKLHKIGP